MENFELNQDKINAMYTEIRIAEAENLRTGKKTGDGMVKEIIAIIQNNLKEKRR